MRQHLWHCRGPSLYCVVWTPETLDAVFPASETDTHFCPNNCGSSPKIPALSHHTSWRQTRPAPLSGRLLGLFPANDRRPTPMPIRHCIVHLIDKKPDGSPAVLHARD